MVTVTPEAHEELVRLLDEEIGESDDVTLRISLRPG